MFRCVVTVWCVVRTMRILSVVTLTTGMYDLYTQMSCGTVANTNSIHSKIWLYMEYSGQFSFTNVDFVTYSMNNFGR